MTYSTNIKVSILVPIYGVEKYIERCAVSLFEQTYKNIEYIFVDDCGTDNSIGILKDVINRYPRRKEHTRIIRHARNRGLAAARNTAVKEATGVFICHVDSDDWINERFLEVLMQKQIETQADIVKGGNIMYLPKGTKRRAISGFDNNRDYTLKLIAKQTPSSIWGGVIRKSLYTKYGISAIEGVNLGEDYCVTPRLAYYASKLTFVEDCNYNYECRNVDSYTYTYSQAKEEQAILAWKLINEFCMDKGTDFQKAAVVSLVQMRFMFYKTAIKDNITPSWRVEELRKLVLNSSEDLSSIPIADRILLHIRSKFISKEYIKFAGIVKRLISK